MQISQNGLKLLKDFEGFCAAPYQDQGGLWTIGYGVRISDPSIYPNGITQQQAEALLQQHLGPVEYEINSVVLVVLNQNQFDALCCFVYNIGGTNFKNSTMLKYLNMGSFPLAAGEFPRWDHIGGVPNKGLLNRRLKEQALFNTPC